ncbi:S8 family peptidase [Kribbella sp. NPDC026611]|uniref:S8 family peptidase n=1 Tax=Kribbella sp. NPDC026611 TaxID=3154911 RepID=UPI0033E28B4C
MFNLATRPLTLSVTAALVLAAGVTAQPAVAAPSPGPTATYIVQLAETPAAGYTGNVRGYKATRPSSGAKFNGRSADAGRYRGYLKTRHDTVARQAGITKLYDYSIGFNGFAATMTASKAAQLARTPGVLSVSKNEIRSADTVSTPGFLGLDKPGGLWEQLGGPSKAGGGKNLVIGDIDSGIWPESASFAPLANPGPLTGFHGSCAAAEQWATTNCSNKIVGARYYNAGIGGDATVKAAPYVNEVASPRDINGHGSHTASTAAGDYNTDMVVNGNSLGKGSGMAPAARIAVYKALWHTGASASGSTADLVQAIEDAILDGVDVINYSVSGSQTSDVDPVEVEFLYAAAAGIFVSASAGNSGPGSATVAHNSPWLTTVAAGTHDRQFQATVTLGNGASYTGAGIGAAVPSSPIILSTSAGQAGAAATGTRLCFSKTWDPARPQGYLDPALVAGKIVVCDRGTNDRTDKSKAVREAGGVGMVLANTSPNSLNADLHTLPTVHVSDVDGAAIKAYVNASPGATASLSAGTKVVGAEAPAVAGFSSRGPALAGAGDLLKPDIMAPGVDVLAAVSPASGGLNFNFESGTSMAAPHITGIAALLRQLHPTWTPMMIKSALMTSASTLDNKGNPIPNAGPLDYGSGQVTPNSAADPGLVYNSGPIDWTRFLCGTGELPSTNLLCKLFGTRDPSDLNTPNIAIGDLAGSQTVTRTVTNVGTKRATYKAAVTAPPGVTVAVSPSTLTVAPGRSASYKVTFSRTTAAYDVYTTGSLQWSDGTHSVRSQLVVRPVGAKAVSEVTLTGQSGSTGITVTPGYIGTLQTTVAGLAAGAQHTATLTAGGTSFPTGSPAVGPHTAKFTVTVPAGTKLARFATFDSDVQAGTDLDLFVYTAGTNTLVGSSSGSTAQERVDLANPAGSYDVYVDQFALPAGVTQQAVSEFDWAVGAATGNLTATPASAAVTAATPFTVTASWSGLTAGTRYLGTLTYGDGTNTYGRTVIAVNA